jgi:hypothetical protein
MRKKTQKEETERKFKESQNMKKEYERFQSLSMGQKLYEVVYFYGKSLTKNPSTLEMAKKVFTALSDFRNLNFTSMRELFDELKNDNDETLQGILPYWEELLCQCEEAVKKEESSKYVETKQEYTKNNMFNKFISQFKDTNTSGRKR